METGSGKRPENPATRRLRERTARDPLQTGFAERIGFPVEEIPAEQVPEGVLPPESPPVAKKQPGMNALLRRIRGGK